MISRGTVADLREQAGLIQNAAIETGIDASAIKWDVLKRIEAAGNLLVLVVRDGERVAGWACATVGPALWHDGLVVETLSLYVDPMLRGRWGWSLILNLIEEARRMGAELRVSAVAGSHFDRLLAERWPAMHTTYQLRR